MGLSRELSNTGVWLFRWRSFLPLTMVAGAIVALFEGRNLHHDTPLAITCETLAIVLCAAGLVIRCLIVGHTPARTSGRNTREQIADSLNTTGIYSAVRHPLYFANFLIGLGFAAYTLMWWFVVIYILTFWLYYERIMMAEERFLSERFGNEFYDWAQRTPVFVPNFQNYVRPALPFSLKNVLRREYNTVLQIAVVASILEFCGDWFETGHPAPSMPWCIFLGCGFLIWLILRTFKRQTGLLVVDGR